MHKIQVISFNPGSEQIHSNQWRLSEFPFVLVEGVHRAREYKNSSKNTQSRFLATLETQYSSAFSCRNCAYMNSKGSNRKGYSESERTITRYTINQHLSNTIIILATAESDLVDP